jgi:hypothetical protein
MLAFSKHVAVDIRHKWCVTECIYIGWYIDCKNIHGMNTLKYVTKQYWFSVGTGWVMCSGTTFFLLWKQNVRLISRKALHATFQSIRSHQAMCLMSAKTGRWNCWIAVSNPFRRVEVPLYFVPLLFFKDSSISTCWYSVQGALQISINKDLEPDSYITWNTLFCTAPEKP